MKILQRENYRYAAAGQRTFKTTGCSTGDPLSKYQVRYLPMTEIRCQQKSDGLHSRQVIGMREVQLLRSVAKGYQLRYSGSGLNGHPLLELNQSGQLISREDYYPFGGTARWATRSQCAAWGKILRYGGKERDFTGLIYYGFRYYLPWLLRWLNPDPAAAADGFNFYRYARNNATTCSDRNGKMTSSPELTIGESAINAEEQSDTAFWEKVLVEKKSQATFDALNILARHKHILNETSLGLEANEAAILKIYSQENKAKLINSYLRYGVIAPGQEGSLANCSTVDYIIELFDVINKLPVDTCSNVLFRGGHSARSTSGFNYLHGEVKTGDILINADVTSFTGNPYKAVAFSQPGIGNFDITSVIFKLTSHKNARIFSPFSDFEDEAESIYRPGAFFSVKNITRVNVSAGLKRPQNFIQVELNEVERSGNLDNLYDFRTGQPFSVSAYTAMLVKGGGNRGSELANKIIPRT